MRTFGFFAYLAFVPVGACSAQLYPPTPLPAPMRDRLVVQDKFRVGTLRFGPDSHDGKYRAAGHTIPAVILEELARDERFSVYEGDGLGDVGDVMTAESAHRYVDAYLNGTITQLSNHQACFEVRLANAHTHEVLFAGYKCAKIVGSEGLLEPAQNSLQTFAHDIADVLPMIDNATVLTAEDRLITLDVGGSRVKRGMVGYLTATGGTIQGSHVESAVAAITGDELRSDTAGRVVIGEFYVLDVGAEHCEAVLYRGDYAVPGDTAYFK